MSRIYDFTGFAPFLPADILEYNEDDDDNGNVKSAYYGKIYGDFNMQDIDGVEFLYYLNPILNDRNLEWDMKNNLCPNPGNIGQLQP